MTIFPRALKAAMPAALLFVVAAPVLAQTPPPPGGSATAPRGEVRERPGPMHRMQGGMFQSLSPAGRATMREAMKGSQEARKADRQAVQAARDRMLAVLEAEKLDVSALKRAMAEERTAANASRDRFQAAMLAGFQKLSLADRRAFVVEARQMRGRMEERMKGWKGRHGGEDMPEPPMLF